MTISLRRRFVFASVVLVSVTGLALAACSNEDAPASNPGPESDARVTCENDIRVVPYSPNMPKTSTKGIFTATLVSADPAPPVVTSDGQFNTWVIRITDANQVPIPDDSNIRIKPEMPDHGHGPSTSPVITPKGNGTFEISKLNLFMPGVWWISIYTKVPAKPDEEDFARYVFCLPG